MLKLIIAIFLIYISVIAIPSYARNTTLGYRAATKEQSPIKTSVNATPSIMGMSPDTFWPSVGAAVGGFVGTIIFFFIRTGIEFFRARRKNIKTYLCGNELNQGQDSESEGELMHHHGKRLAIAEELLKYDVDHPVWEWSREPVGRLPLGGSVIYGPYTTDFEEAGLYSAKFRIKAIGLSRPKETINDRILFELDVTSTLTQYTPVQNDIRPVGALRKIARKYIRASELATGDWIDFEMKFYSDSQGIWEYRVLAYDGSEKRPDNIAALGGDVRFLFDTVSIVKLKSFNLPWI